MRIIKGSLIMAIMAGARLVAAQSTETKPATDAEKVADALRAGPDFITKGCDAPRFLASRRKAAPTGCCGRAPANGPVFQPCPGIRTTSRCASIELSWTGSSRVWQGKNPTSTSLGSRTYVRGCVRAEQGEESDVKRRIPCRPARHDHFSAPGDEPGGGLAVTAPMACLISIPCHMERRRSWLCRSNRRARNDQHMARRGFAGRATRVHRHPACSHDRHVTGTVPPTHRG